MNGSTGVVSAGGGGSPDRDIRGSGAVEKLGATTYVLTMMIPKRGALSVSYVMLNVLL